MEPSSFRTACCSPVLVQVEVHQGVVKQGSLIQQVDENVAAHAPKRRLPAAAAPVVEERWRRLVLRRRWLLRRRLGGGGISGGRTAARAGSCCMALRDTAISHGPRRKSGSCGSAGSSEMFAFYLRIRDVTALQRYKLSPSHPPILASHGHADLLVI